MVVSTQREALQRKKLQATAMELEERASHIPGPKVRELVGRFSQTASELERQNFMLKEAASEQQAMSWSAVEALQSQLAESEQQRASESREAEMQLATLRQHAEAQLAADRQQAEAAIATERRQLEAFRSTAVVREKMHLASIQETQAACDQQIQAMEARHRAQLAAAESRQSRATSAASALVR